MRKKSLRSTITKQICNKCNIEKDVSKFEWQKGRPNPRKTCIACRQKDKIWSLKQKEEYKKYKKEYYNSGQHRITMERRKYGIAKEDLLYKHCVICGSTQRLVLDHDHVTNKFRALLCNKCNVAIGLFDESIEKMQNAISYLEHFNKGGKAFIEI